jgi:hypothetical protein
MKLVRAFEVPDLSAQSRDAAARTRDLIDAVAARLQAGESFLIYPSGRLQRGDREIVGSARVVHELLTRCPEVNVVLIRTRGLWGSIFSCARRGTLPDLGRKAVAAIGWGLASLVFFLPRRPVHLHAEVIPRDRLPLGSREEFNAFLESWYDADGGQKPLFVRYHALFGPSSGRFEAASSGVPVDPATISPKTIRLVNEMLASHLRRDLAPDELRAETRFDAIGLDSLDRMELALTIEQQFADGTHNLGKWWWLSRGYTSAGVEAWNCIRALDYLETRPEVDKSRFGVTGRSGGGAYSWWIAALDDRIKAAAPRDTAYPNGYGPLNILPTLLPWAPPAKGQTLAAKLGLPTSGEFGAILAGSGVDSTTHGITRVSATRTINFLADNRRAYE